MLVRGSGIKDEKKKNSLKYPQSNRMHDDNNESAYKHPHLLLPWASTHRNGKVNIKELFKDDKVDGIPIFPCFNGENIHKRRNHLHRESQEKVQVDIRSLISRSTHHVPSTSRKNSSSKEIQLKVDQLMRKSQELHIGSIQDIRKDYLNISRQLGLIANLKQDHSPSRSPSPTTSNSFRMRQMSSLHRLRKEERKRTEKTKIIPWQKSETQEDGFLQN